MHVDQPLNFKFKIKTFGALDQFDTSLWIKILCIFEMQLVFQAFTTHIWHTYFHHAIK
jgi:hypothetical protein